MHAYLAILRKPGALRFSAWGMVARSGGSMMSIGIVLLVSAEYHSYAKAGLLAAVNMIAWALLTAPLARAVDRFGQKRIMFPSTLVAGSGAIVLAVLASAHVNFWLLLIPAAINGGFEGSPGSMARARWNHLLSTPADIHTAFSLESTLDELNFLVGPVLTTLLSTGIAPWLGVLIPGSLQIFGGSMFFTQTATQPPTRKPTAAENKAHTRAGRFILGMTTGSSFVEMRPLTPVIVIFLLIGLSAGGIDVSFVAAAGAWHARTYAGLMLACISLGSGTAGFLYGSRVWRQPLAKRFAFTVSALTVSFGLLFLATSPLVLAPLAVLAGCTIAPSIINGNSLAQHLVPESRLTEGFALIGAGLGVGNSIGATIAGKMIDHFDYHGGFSTVLAGGAVALVVTLAFYRTIASRDMAAR